MTDKAKDNRVERALPPQERDPEESVLPPDDADYRETSALPPQGRDLEKSAMPPDEADYHETSAVPPGKSGQTDAMSPRREDYDQQEAER